MATVKYWKKGIEWNLWETSKVNYAAEVRGY